MKGIPQNNLFLGQGCKRGWVFQLGCVETTLEHPHDVILKDQGINPPSFLGGSGSYGSPDSRDMLSEFHPYCWWKKSCTSWYDKYPIIYIGFHASPVVQDFSHQQYESLQVLLGWKVVILVILCAIESSPCYPCYPLLETITWGYRKRHWHSWVDDFPFPQVLWFLMLPKTNSLQGTKVFHHWKRNIIFSLLMGICQFPGGYSPLKNGSFEDHPRLPFRGQRPYVMPIFTGGTCYCSFQGGLVFQASLFVVKSFWNHFAQIFRLQKNTHRDSQPTCFFVRATFSSEPSSKDWIKLSRSLGGFINHQNW